MSISSLKTESKYMMHLIQNCPKRGNIKRLCAGAGSRPLNYWTSDIPPGGTPPPDIILYVEWELGGLTFKLYKYEHGLNAMCIPGEQSYMIFNDDIRRDFTLVRYFEDEYNNLISYTVGE